MDNNLKLTTTAFCFYDILGFIEVQQKYFKQGKAEELLNCFYSVLSEAQGFLSPIRGRGYIKSFTDNFAFGIPVNNDAESELGVFFTNITSHQLYLAVNGLFMRGAITVDQLYMDEHMVFGPALINAVMIEKENAIYPRVVLGPCAIKKMLKHLEYYSAGHAPQVNYILLDEDGQYFINYLKATIDLSQSLYEEEVLQNSLEKAREHQIQIIKCLEENEADQKIKDKYTWLAQYHNYFCIEFLDHNGDLLIDLIDVPKRHFNRII